MANESSKKNPGAEAELVKAVKAGKNEPLKKGDALVPRPAIPTGEQLTFETLREEVRDVMVEEIVLEEGETMEIYPDASAGAMTERVPFRAPVIGGAARLTPPPLPKLAKGPVLGNRFLRLVQALPEDYRAQYVLALATRLSESIKDPLDDSSPDENLQKIEAISWVVNQWKGEKRIPAEYVQQIIGQIEHSFSTAFADRNFAECLNQKDYDDLCGLIDGLKDVITERCLDSQDPVGRDQVQRIRNAFRVGDIDGGNRIMRQFFNSADSFYRMGKEGYQGLAQRNFMAEKSEVFPLVDYFRGHELKAMTDQNSRLRILELGPGIGNDALMWVRMSGVAQYLGVDANPKAVETSNRRIKEMFAKGMRGKVANVVMGNFIDHLEAIQRNAHEHMKKSDKRFKTIVVGISVLHYLAVEEREFKRILGVIRDIVAPTRGRLVMATKTPRSDTCRLHTVVQRDGGRVIGISRPEKIARAFMERDYLVSVLKDVGFDVERATLMKQIVKEYDFPGFNEEFECVIAQPKEPTKK